MSRSWMVLVVAVLVSAAWGIMPFLNPPRGLGPVSESDFIRSRFPFQLVNPDTVLPEKGIIGESIMLSWMFAESKARLALIFVLWCVVGVVLFLRARRITAARPAYRLPTCTDLHE